MVTLINAPSILGCRPTGVEQLPDALLQAGLAQQLQIEKTYTVTPPAYDSQRDPETHMLNPHSIARYSVELADSVQQVLRDGGFPLVLGGDCGILLGPTLALKRMGRYGLFFIDGHADFYQPEASITGEAADMDLALISGRGPELVTNLENQQPYMQDEDIILYGQRDRRETIEAGSQQVADTPIHVYELETIRQKGVEQSCRTALATLLNQPIEGFWIHIDADAINDEEMPAVDYRQPGGLTFRELQTILQMLLASKKAVGLSLTDYNPKLDPNGHMAAKLVELLALLNRK